MKKREESEDEYGSDFESDTEKEIKLEKVI